MAANPPVPERELCRKCEGNGVLPIRNAEGTRIGIETCPRCYGDCWEPSAPVAASPESQEQNMDNDIVKGTYNCPVCGWNQPHSEHAGDQILRLSAELREERMRAVELARHLTIAAGQIQYGATLNYVHDINRLTERYGHTIKTN